LPGDTGQLADQSAPDARLVHGVPRVRHDDESGLGPGAMQVPRRANRADDVVASLHDRGRNAPDLPHPAQELIVTLEEAAVREVVALDAGERLGETGPAHALKRAP